MRPGIVTVRFTSRWPWNPGSLIIGALSGSPEWLSHCFATIEGRTYEASMGHGCRAVPEVEAMKGIKRYQDMPIWVPDLDASIAFGEAQDGKGYDYAGAGGIPLLKSQDWADDSKWWCSELVFAILMAGGTFLLDPAEKKRVTPNNLRMCYYPKTALVYA